MTLCHTTITLLDHTAAHALATTVVTGTDLPAADIAGPTVWLLATARDGLITGHYHPELGLWSRSSDLAAPGTGTLALHTLELVRLFSLGGETLLRATPDGHWRGRRLTDTHPADSHDDLTRPIDRDLLLATGTTEALGDFRRVTTSSGLSHILPATWTGRRLRVRDYLSLDPRTGQARIGGSRCVALIAPDRKGT